eukprot:29023-Chlamydomonas_euryale.AAC.9
MPVNVGGGLVTRWTCGGVWLVVVPRLLCVSQALTSQVVRSIACFVSHRRASIRSSPCKSESVTTVLLPVNIADSGSPAHDMSWATCVILWLIHDAVLLTSRVCTPSLYTRFAAAVASSRNSLDLFDLFLCQPPASTCTGGKYAYNARWADPIPACLIQGGACPLQRRWIQIGSPPPKPFSLTCFSQACNTQSIAPPELFAGTVPPDLAAGSAQCRSAPARLWLARSQH